jgi:SAM-dependent methyltransferase
MIKETIGFFTRRLNARIIKERFVPSLSLGWLLNPSFILRRLLLDDISELIRKHASCEEIKILDLGCGSSPYRFLFRSEHYIRMDVDQSGHTHEDELIDIIYDGKVIPLQNGSIDFVLLTEVIEHVFEPDQVFAEIMRVLSPKGMLLITAPFVWEEHEVPYDYARYTSFGLTYSLSKNGFILLDSKKTGNSFGVIFQLISSMIFNIFSNNPVARRFMHLFIGSQISLLGYAITKLLDNATRKPPAMYLNNVILVRKA